MPKRNKSFEFKWIPGTPPDPHAVRRLKQAFPRPKEPMGEAWFMSVERRYFRELCDRDLQDVDTQELFEVLYNISSGVTCFGFRDEWRDWFHYVLAHLVEQAHGVDTFDRWSELLISAFMTQYPAGMLLEPYEGFLEDIFKTLAVSSMHPDLWTDNEIILGKSLLIFGSGVGRWGWSDEVSGDFSAQMFFCLKYLPASAINVWLQSIIKLPSRYYQAQFLLWLIGTKEILLGNIESPEDFPKQPAIRVVWGVSHNIGLRLSGDGFPYEKAVFLPKENVAAFQKSLSENLTQSIVRSWLRGFGSVLPLKKEILDCGRGKDFLDMFDSSGKVILYSANIR